jgi:hypothetical protein
LSLPLSASPTAAAFVFSWLILAFIQHRLDTKQNLNTTVGLSIDNKGLSEKPKGFYSNLSKKMRSSGIFFFFKLATHESTMAGDPQM